MKSTLTTLLKIALSYKGWMILATFLGFMTIGSGIGLMMTSAYIIAKAALHPSISDLQVGIVGVRFFGIARGLFRYLERYVSHEVTFRLLARFRVWFYKAVEPLDPAGLQKYRSSDLLTRIVADVESLEHIYVRVIAPPLAAIAVSVLMWFLFGIFNLIFSALLLLFFILGGVGIPLFTHILSKQAGRHLITLRSSLNEMAVDGVQGMAELLAFGRIDDYHKQFNDLNLEYIQLQRRMALINALNESLIGLLMNITIISILLSAIPMISASLMDGIMLSVLTIGTMAAFEAILPLPASAQYLENSLKAAERLFEITNAKPAVKDIGQKHSETNNFDISIKNLDFKYRENESFVFRGLSLEITEKTSTVVVGSSGAGKSTLINLLMRFWDYNSGEIRIGQHNLRSFIPEKARTFFAVVSQNTHLFNGTIKENLLLANPSAAMIEVERCAQQAQIHDFIANLPMGYDTWIGEHGFRLSAGQRQRLAIARAILKKAPVIILDEATANLDTVTEEKIMQTIWQIAKGKTLIIFTHRLAGLDKADQIVVIDKGRIVERGQHKQLLKNKGHYYQFHTIQNQFLHS